MIILVSGVPDSGKSACAEGLAVKLAGDAPKIYIATMIPYGEEGRKRVSRHRAAREGKGFETIEWPEDIGSVVSAEGVNKKATCLLECMSNLVGNEMHRGDKEETESALKTRILNGVKELSEAVENLIIVTNEFPLYDESYDRDTLCYVNILHEINSELAVLADERYDLQMRGTEV